MTYRASIAERIAWTSALRPVDARVLQALSTFAHFETGQHAFMGMNKLVARVGLPRRTVERALHALEAGGWITASRRHRHATSYGICVDRLATNYMGAKVVSPDPRSVRQVGGQPEENLSATFDDQSAKSSNFVRQLGGPIPSTYPDLDPSAPPLRVGSLTETVNADDDDEPRGGESATQSAAPDPDLCADDRDHPDHAGGRSPGSGSDQTPTSGVGLPLRQRPDLPGATSPDRSGAPVEPQQQTLGPRDVSARRDNIKKALNVMREALQQRKSG